MLVGEKKLSVCLSLVGGIRMRIVWPISLKKILCTKSTQVSRSLFFNWLSLIVFLTGQDYSDARVRDFEEGNAFYDNRFSYPPFV